MRKKTAHFKPNVWSKASRSNGNGGNNCVEAFNFKKASKSNPSGNCVEVADFKKGTKSGPNSDNCVEVSFDAASKSGPAGHCVEVGFDKSSLSALDRDCVEVGFNTASKSVAVSDCVEVGTVESSSNGEPVNWAAPGTCQCDTPVMNGQTIEGLGDGDVIVRDSKQNGAKDQPFIVMSREQWKRFIDGLKLGFGAINVNLGTKVANASIASDDNPWKIVGSYQGKTICLSYNDGEWDAFMDGVHKGEFDVKDGTEEAREEGPGDDQDVLKPKLIDTGMQDAPWAPLRTAQVGVLSGNTTTGTEGFMKTVRA